MLDLYAIAKLISEYFLVLTLTIKIIPKLEFIPLTTFIYHLKQTMSIFYPIVSIAIGVSIFYPGFAFAQVINSSKETVRDRIPSQVSDQVPNIQGESKISIIINTESI
jgi:uncharacterized membrane protein